MNEIETKLVSARENIMQKAKGLFLNKAVEAHVFGSIARGDADAYSDIDIWFTFNDADYDDLYKDRFEYYKNLGDIIHAHEAPQNAPIRGVHTALLVKADDIISVVDIYLCPLSTAYITEEGRKLFGLDLPMGTIGFNPKKITVDEDYRINFLICFIFNTIKKIARNDPNSLEAVLREYENLYKNYGIPVEPLSKSDQDLTTLEIIIENTQKIANAQQKVTLVIIRDFAEKIFG